MAYAANVKALLTAFKETVCGHFAGVGGLIAGLIVAWQLNVFQTVPWAIAIYPTVLTAKAIINGMFSGRLNTALHIGTISPRFSGNMKTLGRMLQRVLALTLATAVAMSIVSTVLGSLFLGVGARSFLDILVVVVATMSLGLTTYLFTLPVTFTAFKRGFDLDSVAYPIAATIADALITAWYALTVNIYFKFGDIGKYAIILIAILPMVLTLYSLRRRIYKGGFSKTIKTSILALMFVAVIASFTGVILQKTILQKTNVFVNIWSGNHALYLSAVIAAYPAMIELVGDAALVIGSTATTGLVLGLLEPSFSAVKNHAPQIIGAWAASAIVFVPLSAASLFLTGKFALPVFSLMTSMLLVTNAFAMIAMILISYSFAILTFKKGLDPDHLVVPLESSLAGAITSTALLVALFLLLH